ncbi:hypothetical protein BH11MYX2_BH11MYX2_27860 [soil metagenome]
MTAAAWSSMRHPQLSAMLLAVAASFAASACATSEDGDELGITCEGKCDGLSSVKALIADAKLLDLQDLINVGAGFATDQLNNSLTAGNYASLQIQPTALYAPAAVAAQDLTLKNLDTLVSGLAARFGETSLTTEVNSIRADYLRTSGKRVYAESAFKIAASLSPNWSIGTKGFGADATATATLGFDAGVDIQARTITVHDSENGGLAGAPLAAIKATRGFVLPRSVEDIKVMKPGESVALAGQGHLGINLGAGVPILIANPASALTYSLVLSAGFRSLLDGELDVQLVHAKGSEVVIDVGVSRGTLKSKFIALTDGWGVSGLVQSSFSIPGVNVDLGKLLDKAIQKKLNDKLHLISARAESTQQALRLSVARLRFNLDGADPTGGRAQALAQAMKGDVRLAQALAARGDSGVMAEFDLTRSGASAISYAGVDVLGMSFYTRTAASEGSAVLQTPGGVLAMMWDSLHKAGGWFFESHGFTRIGVAGLQFDAEHPGAPKSSTNLFLQTEEGDDFMDRDKVIDQIDSTIVAVGGMNALRAIEAKGNQLEQLIVARCPLPTGNDFFDESCNMSLLGTSEVTNLHAAALVDFDAAISSLPAESKALLHKLGDLRLSAQSIEDANAQLVGPTASIVLDFRMDDGALKQLFTKDKTAFKQAVSNLMQATQLDRKKTDVTGERMRIAQKSDDVAGQLGDIFATNRATYERLMSIDGASIEGLGAIGGNAIEVRYSVDSSNRPKYDDAVSQSVAQARSQLVGAMFDQLRSKADSMPSSGGTSPAHAEQIAAYALLALSAPDKTELRFDLTTDNTSGPFRGSQRRYDAAGFKTTDVFAKGASVAPIGAGIFDVDAIIQAPN